MKNLTLPAFIIILLFLSCSKNKQSPGCTTNKMCTLEFAIIGMKFTGTDGNPAKVKNLTVVNQRTGLSINTMGNSGLNIPAGNRLIATDANKAEFSTDGDDVKVTATDSVSNKTKTAILKISGGCSCHVGLVSGPTELKFD